MQQALANSYNLSTVRLANEFGLSAFSNKLKQFGVSSDIPAYPSIYLGAVNIWSETNPYAITEDMIHENELLVYENNQLTYRS